MKSKSGEFRYKNSVNSALLNFQKDLRKSQMTFSQELKSRNTEIENLQNEMKRSKMLEKRAQSIILEA